MRTTLTLLALVAGASAFGQVLFQDDFDSDTTAQWTVDGTAGFAVNPADTDTADTRVNFSFDYSTTLTPIPAAPGGVTTRGLRFSMNDFAPANVATIIARPTGKNFTGTYETAFDQFLFRNAVGTSTTEYAVYGMNAIDQGPFAGAYQNATSGGSAAGLAPWNQGAAYSVTVEGGAARDYRTYRTGAEILYNAAEPPGPAGFLAQPYSVGEPPTLISPHEATNTYYTGTFAPLGVPLNAWARVRMVQGITATGRIVQWWQGGLKIVDRLEPADTVTEGNIYLGGMDLFSSVDPLGNVMVVYDNLQVRRPATIRGPISYPSWNLSGQPTITAVLRDASDNVVRSERLIVRNGFFDMFYGDVADLGGATTLNLYIDAPNRIRQKVSNVNVALNAMTTTAAIALAPGDIDDDEDVDIDDYDILAFAYGSFNGDPNFNAAADLDQDGDVDIDDYDVLANNYGLIAE